jgi:hypothetical protein
MDTDKLAEMLPQIVENVDKMIELSEKKIETLRELRRTLDLAHLVPEVMKEKAKTRIIEGDRWSFAPWRSTKLQVTVGEAVLEFDLVKDKVPESLWPKDILEQYRRHQARQTKQVR